MDITSSKLVIAISYNNNFGLICNSIYVNTACKISEIYSKRLVKFLFYMFLFLLSDLIAIYISCSWFWGKKDDAAHHIHFLNNERVLHQWLFSQMEHHCFILLPFQNSFEANLWLYLSTCLYRKYLSCLIIFCLCRFVAMYEGNNLKVSECVQHILPNLFIIKVSP